MNHYMLEIVLKDRLKIASFLEKLKLVVGVVGYVRSATSLFTQESCKGNNPGTFYGCIPIFHHFHTSVILKFPECQPRF